VKVELLYFDGCPGYAELRERLPGVLEGAGAPVAFEERRVDSLEAVTRERFPGPPPFGSTTVTWTRCTASLAGMASGAVSTGPVTL
jgi:hypothetical protein